MLERASGDGTVLILPTASAPEGEAVFRRWAQMGLDHYAELGIPARLLEVRERDDAQRADLAEAVSEASAVYFSGGNPAFLAETLAGTALWSAILEGLDRGLAYAGCSAGAAALGDRALDSGVAAQGRLGEIWRPGLDVFPRTLVAPHWDMVDTYLPGIQAWFRSQVQDGGRLLAIDERTALAGDGSTWTVMGSGTVLLADQQAETTTIAGGTLEADLADSRQDA
jgi:cyanophycinase